jgi:hypothetical protein
MHSAFGVEHGEQISKLGPHIRGYANTLHEVKRDGSGSRTHAPTDVKISDTGKKTLLLRRKKYRYEAKPDAKTLKGLSTDKSEVYLQRTFTKPNRANRKELSEFMSSGKKNTKLSDGTKVKRGD